MSYAERHQVDVITDSGGDAEAFTPTITGRVQAIHYVKNDFAAGVDFTITVESTGETVWSELNVDASAVRAPRQPTHDTAGAVETYDATQPVNDHIVVANDRLKIVVANGGNAKSGTFHVIVA